MLYRENSPLIGLDSSEPLRLMVVVMALLLLVVVESGVPAH
jgi:hypothetical protein